MLFGMAGTTAAIAQQPDSTRARADSVLRAKADSALADSLALVKELERATAGRPAQPQGGGSTNSRLLPDLSVVGDLIFDLSREGSTQDDGSRFGIREIEVALQAAVDPYFRGDVYLGFSDEEGVSIEQAYLTATALPWQLEGRLGRFIVPFGKQNLTHRHDLHTIEYPWVLQRFLGPEGRKGTGGYLSKIFSPLGFYQELIVTVLDRFGEPAEDLTANEPSNQNLSGLGYTARLRNFWDLTRHANLELAASAGTGTLAQPVSGPSEFNAINARQSLLGVDVTYRWRPLQQGLYRSLIVQAEYLRQFNEPDPALPEGMSSDMYLGPRRAFDGAYLFARYQVSRRGHLGTRGDVVEDPMADGRTLYAASGYYEFFPSEFSKLVAGYERLWPQGEPSQGRLILQATFALGPHRPHPF
jgi:hypothetical protein